MYVMKDKYCNIINKYKYQRGKQNIRELSNKIGITEGYLSQIVDKKKTNISKTLAYAISKAISINLEITDVFNIL